MKWLNEYKMKMILFGFVAAIVFGGGRAKADFTFGEPTNLGPKVNSTAEEWDPSISGDGLTLYFTSRRSGGYGDYDLWMTTRQTVNDDWSEPINLGRTVNSSGYESAPDISADGLSLFFSSDREGTMDLYVVTRIGKNDAWQQPVKLGPGVNSLVAECESCISADSLSLFISDFPNGPFISGGYGKSDIWLTTRPAVSDTWNPVENIGPLINTSYVDSGPSISRDGLILFFYSNRPGGSGDADVWFTRRSSTTQDWQSPIWLGPNVNHSSNDCNPDVSSDGRTLYLTSDRTGSIGSTDLWQVSIDPIIDLNGDLKVDLEDMHIMVDHWGEYYPLCDIGPTPLGDGVVDIQDMIVLAEHLYRLTAHWKLDETDGNIAHDSFGEYDGTVNGNPSWLPTGGIKGGSLMLDGIDDYIEAPFILDPSKGPFSVFAWIKCWMPGQVIISQKGLSGGTWLGTNSSGEFMSGFGDVNFGALESESVITDIQWHNVGFVYDTDTLHRRLYVDGILVAEDTSAIVGESSNDGLYIGASKDLGSGTLFSGFVDDVRIYKQALTAKEIAALAQ